MGVPLVPPADRALVRPARRRTAAAVAFAALFLVGAATLLDLRPPAPRGTDAPATVFSADRAYSHVQRIATRTHPAGSPANEEVRAHLEAVLRGLGLETSVQDTVANEAGQLSSSAGGANLARVRNLVARLPGTASTGRVFLVAHYDSVQSGPGGNDDAAGTAAILEAARALAAGPRPRNDVVFVLTDAEEACLCGAAAFVDSHPLAADGGVVINLEARGSTGPVIMFETSRNNAALVNAFGRVAPHPVGTSFAVEIYRLLPNDTDFTAFLDRPGFVGLNSAYIDGAAIYHTPLDTPEAMNRGSLQQHGENALALAREFGRIDLTDLSARDDATYFPVPGSLVRYPGWLVWPLASAALVAVAALGWLARRRGRTSWPRIGAGFGLALVPVLLAPLAAQLLWLGITAIRPGYAEMVDPYRPVWYRLAVVALAAGVLLAWYALTRRRTGPAALAIGGLGLLAVLGTVLAVFAPGGAYLATLPALGGAVAGLVALAVQAGRSGGPGGSGGSGPLSASGRSVASGGSGARTAVALGSVTVGAAVGVLVLLPTVVLLFPALGLGMGGVAALFAVLLGLAALPVLDLLLPEAGGQRAMVAVRARRAGAVPALAATVAALVCAGVGLAVDRFDATHPVPTHLMYALDAGTGQARWLSRESKPRPWTDGYVEGTKSHWADFPALGPKPLRTGPAPAAPLAAPRVETVADSTSGTERVLRIRLVPQRPVRLVTLHLATGPVRVVRAAVGGRSVPLPDEADPHWSFGLMFHAPPAEGIEVELNLSGTGPVTLRAMDASDGLDGLPGFRPRPADVGVVGSHSSEMVAVARTYQL